MVMRKLTRLFGRRSKCADEAPWIDQIREAAARAAFLILCSTNDRVLLLRAELSGPAGNSARYVGSNSATASNCGGIGLQALSPTFQLHSN